MEIWEDIIAYYLPIKDVKNISLTSTFFRELAGKTMWRKIQLTDLTDIYAIKHLLVNQLDISKTGCTDLEISLLSEMSTLRKLVMHSNDTVTCVGLIGISKLPLHELGVSNCGLNDSHMSILGQMTSLQTLNMENNPAVTDSGLSHLTGLTQLLELRMGKCHQLTDAGMLHLQCVCHLNTLNINGCYKVTCHGLSHLIELPLQDLSICQLLISDSYMAVVGQMSHLRKLRMSGGNILSNHVTDIGMSHLSRLSLKCFSMYDSCGVSTSGLSCIQSKSLQEIYFSSCSNEHLLAIGRFLNLTKLDISNNANINNTGMAYLKDLTKLEYFDISDCVNIRGTSLDYIHELPIREFYIRKICSDSAFLLRLRKFNHLEKLVLSRGKGVTDKTLALLTTLPKLKYLDISECKKVTPAGRALFSDRIKLIF